MSDESPPLEFVYAAIFGAQPGPEVAGSLRRLDQYLRGKVTHSTATLLCIALHPVDLYARTMTTAERQLHATRLLLAQEVTALRSEENLTIVRQNEVIRRLSEENERLRGAIGAGKRR